MKLKQYISSTSFRRFFLVVLAFHILYFVLQLIFRRELLADSVQYLSLVKNLLDAGIFYSGNLNDPIDPQGFTQRPPGYPLFLLVVGLGAKSNLSVFLAQNFLSLLTFTGIFRLWEQWGLSKKGWLIVLPSLLFFLGQMIYCNLIMSEILLQSILFWAVFFLIQYVRKPEIRYLWAYNLLLSGAILTKPVFYPFWILNFGLVFFLVWRNSPRFRVLTALLPALTVLLYSGINYARTDYFHYSSINSINLLHYNAYYTLVSVNGENAADSILAKIEVEAALIPEFPKREQFVRQQSLGIMRQHMGSYAQFHLRGMVHFFLDPGRFDIYRFFGWDKGDFKGLLYYFSRDGYAGIFKFLQEQPLFPMLVLLGGMVWNVILLFSFFIFLFLKKVPKETRCIIFVFVAYLCLATGPLGASRFKLPVYPLLLLSWVFLPGILSDFVSGLRKRFME